ncbi:oxysterol-binding protein 1-like [Palaemon carinicauda]|uniref:oxysterol-binding protein 1-like n=1 Tax=Palaemon carinicauda TaxID=392227 RepID=UPI0035B65FDD
MSTEKQSDPDMKGWLYKWTNYLKGYQKRWFVLSNGLLSYYRSQAEMLHTCRGTISLHGAVIHTEDSCNFVISNGGTQTFHLKASSEVERQKWVTALELAKAKAIRQLESGDYSSTTTEDEDEEDVGEAGRDDVGNTLKVLTAKLEDLRTCHDLIIKHGAALQKSLAELETLDNTHDLTPKTKTVNERATLFRISSNAMINACNDYVEVSSTAGRKWQRLLQHERDQRLRLEDMVEQLARQHSHLEQEAKEQMNQAMPPGVQIPNISSQTPVAESDHSSSDGVSDHIVDIQRGGHSHSEDEEETEFEDAVEELAENFIVHVNPSQAHKRSNSNVSQASEGQGVGDTVSASSSEGDGQDNTVQVIMRKDNNTDSSYSLSEEMASLNGSQATTPTEGGMIQANGQPKRQRRTTVPEKPNYPINLWSILKNCIGKELSKIPMPVNFNEPLSFLQRLTEDFEYSDILDRAASVEDSCEQLAMVAAFTVSSYATTSVRTTKPFNPLLGETYECDRLEDYGWRAINEQVCIVIDSVFFFFNINVLRFYRVPFFLVLKFIQKVFGFCLK